MSSATDPPAVRFDLTSQSFKANPFPTLAAIRALGPLIRVRLPMFGTAWMATTYDAVNDVLRDHQRFVQNPAAAGNRGMGIVLRCLPGVLKPLTTNMLLRGAPDHRRLRRLVDRAFQRHSIETMSPRLEALADGELDDFAARKAASLDGTVDLLAHFARPFPLAVICELLGLPPEDRPSFTRWASHLAGAGSGPGILWALFAGVRPMMKYARDEFRRQRARPCGGLMSALVEAEEAGDHLSEDELVAMVFLLLTAGHETTLHQIALSVLTLLDHPGQLDALRADWALVDTAVEELMRYVSFAQTAKPRYAREDTDFHGRRVRRGEMVFVSLAAANADPAEFPEPERLDLGRHPNRHLGFGVGIHYCLGATLARTEIAIALRRLFTRFPGLRLAAPRTRVRYFARFGTRGIMALPVTW